MQKRAAAPPAAAATLDARQAAIVRLLGDLNSEAFAWVVMALVSSQEIPGAKVWPDGLGGFTDRVRMEAIRDEARAYLGLDRG